MSNFKKIAIMALSSMLALSACGEAETSSSVSDNPNSSEAGEAAELPNLVRTNIGAEPDSLDPWQSVATDTEAVFDNVFDGLMNYDSSGQMTKALAEDYSISEDGLVYTFKIREGVKFHNGKDLTVSDVVYTYNRLSGLDGGEPVATKFTVITSVEAGDDNTVAITINEPSGAFLSSTTIPVLPEGYTEQATMPVGTGPYKFVSYTPGQKIVLEKNDDFYDEARMPSIDNVEVYIMTDPSAVVSGLQSGQLDFAQITGENATAIEAAGYTVQTSPQNMVQLMALNNEIEPLNNLKVRQAINYAVNKEEVIVGAFDGYATELDSNFSPVMGHYFNDTLTDYYMTDIEKAKALLTEAGYADGFEMELKVPSNYTAHVNSAQIIAGQLAEIGITVNIELIEWATWLEDVYSNAQYEATIIGLTGKLDPDAILGRYESSYSSNFFNFSDARYDELIKAAKTESDDAKRVEMYKECQQILTENAVAVYISDPNLLVASVSNLKGYTFYPVGFIDFTKLYYEA